MSDLANDPVDPDNNPFNTGPTSRGTIRLLVSVEVEVEDETQLVADSRFLEGIDDEVGQNFVEVESALVGSVGEFLSRNWAAGSKPVRMIHVFCGGKSIGISPQA